MTSALFALALVSGAPVTKDKDGKKDVPSLVGEWAGEKAETAGMPVPVPPGGVTMEFTPDGKLVIKEGGKPPEDAGYTADPKKDPAEVDITPPATARKVDLIRGIYKVEKDTLTLCMGMDGKRPTAFESKAGTAVMLMTLKRAKKKD